MSDETTGFANPVPPAAAGGNIIVRAGVLPGRIEEYSVPSTACVAYLLNELTVRVRAHEPNFNPEGYEVRADNVLVDRANMGTTGLRPGSNVLLVKQVKANFIIRFLRRLFV